MLTWACLKVVGWTWTTSIMSHWKKVAPIRRTYLHDLLCWVIYLAFTLSLSALLPFLSASTCLPSSNVVQLIHSNWSTISDVHRDRTYMGRVYWVFTGKLQALRWVFDMREWLQPAEGGSHINCLLLDSQSACLLLYTTINHQQSIPHNF